MKYLLIAFLLVASVVWGGITCEECGSSCYIETFDGCNYHTLNYKCEIDDDNRERWFTDGTSLSTTLYCPWQEVPSPLSNTIDPTEYMWPPNQG